MSRFLMVLVCAGIVSAACACQAQNLLVNGDLEATPADIYFDGFDPSAADDVPGWNLFLGAADGSYVLVNGVGSGNVDVDMANGPSGGGLETAAGSRPAVAPGLSYKATVTYDNYFTPSINSYFIDWFDGGGSLINSVGGILGDPNGAFGYAPYDQRFTIEAIAPLNAASAGVHFASRGGYAGLAADNFSLRQAPEPCSLGLLAVAGIGLFARRGICR
jgi:hypothetical protein